MARVIGPLLSQDARGSVSGVQFSKNRYGSFGSRKSTGTRAQKGSSTNYRALIGNAHHAFDALTPAQKAAWDLTPQDHTPARQHYLKQYLTRAAREWPVPVIPLPDHGDFNMMFFNVTRFAAPDYRINVSWLNLGEDHGYIDFTTRTSSIASWHGHRRKFRHQAWAQWDWEGRLFDVTPYARYCTLIISWIDFFSLKLYRRWIMTFDDNLLLDRQPEDV